MTLPVILELLGIGLVAGILGGLLGIGGSIIMIPALTWALGPNQHLYQAAAMLMNIVVAFSSSLRHHRAGAIRWEIARRMLPLGVVFIIVGVALSNRIDGDTMQMVFGAFLLYTAVLELYALIRRHKEVHVDHQRTGWVPCGAVSVVMGLTGGLLGIGGGGVTVPLLRWIVRLPIKEAIATSAAVMCLTSIVGAVHKNATLASHLGPDGQPLSIQTSLIIAACMAPTGIIGGMVGAGLTHRLPTVAVKLAFMVLMILASLKMFELL